MKILLRFFFLALPFLSTTVIAQQKLSNSKTSGSYTYIYQLTDKEMMAIALDGKEVINDSYLHTCVDSFKVAEKYLGKLSFGNYLYATPVKNKWEYHLRDNKNVQIAFVNDRKHFQFYVMDLQGNLISTAKVQIGKGKTVKYHAQTGLYQCAYQTKDQVIKVQYNGVSSFFSFEISKAYNYKQNWSWFKKIVYGRPIRYVWMPFKQLYQSIIKPNNNTKPHKGYMVFSKPKYKPLDTVKFKAYLVDEKGKAIKPQDVDVVLVSNNYAEKKVIGTVRPYRNGAYQHSFVLADSLNLKLDRYYNIQLVVKSKTNNKQGQTLLSGNFKYEDYELKSIDFNLRANKATFKEGDSVMLFMKATDENELTVPDGRVKLTLLANSVKEFSQQHVFVPDTLWTKELTLEPSGETKLMVPAHIFPKVDMRFTVKAQFLNSNNESRSASLNLNKEQEVQKPFDINLAKDSLVFTYTKGNKPLKEPILLKWYSFNGQLLDSAILSSSKIKADYRAEYYEVMFGNQKHDYWLTDNNPALSIAAMQTKDSVRVKINNEHKVPFWYTVFSGNRVMFAGYTKQLDTTIKHGTAKAVHVSVSYFWDQEEKTLQASTFYDPNELAVKLIAPDVVYPGQKVNMLVRVTDVDGAPQANVDLTAYAHTAKFGSLQLPYLPKFNKRYYGRKLTEQVEADELYAAGNFKLSWLKWSKELGLDTIEYYKFTNHNSIYITSEDAKDSITQIAPFVINNGEIDPASVVYIDDIPVFFNQVEQLTAYAFAVKPGNHKITMRTAAKTVVLQDVNIPAGKKTILSVSSAANNTQAQITNEPTKMGHLEAVRLNRYLMKIGNTYQPYEKQLISYDTTAVLINPPNQNAGQDILVGPFNANFLTYQDEKFSHHFVMEEGYTYTFLPSLIKQKSYKEPFAFSTFLTAAPRLGNNNYLQQVIRKADIDSIWNSYLDLRSYSSYLFYNDPVIGNNLGRLRFKLADSLIKQPYLKNIIIYKPTQPDFMQIYPGSHKNEIRLTPGKYKLMLLLQNNSYYVLDSVEVKQGGINYYYWDSLVLTKADSLSIKIDSYIKQNKRLGNKIDARIKETVNANSDIVFNNIVRGRVLGKEDQEPIAGANIKVVGLSRAVSSDADGYFNIDAPQNGKISIAFIGYEVVEEKISGNNLGNIYLEGSKQVLGEVVVAGYGSVSKKELTGAVSTVNFGNSLAGKISGLSVGANDHIMIRGMASPQAANQPLVIIDGVPFTGDVATLNKDDLSDVTVLKDASAVAIYGARAANGVIIIKTKKGNRLLSETGELVAQQQTMRTNFSDEGFWKPTLNTDDEGNANFTVKFPDDITSWNAAVIAMNGKKIGTASTKIKSFKTLSANLTAPQFAVVGDSINIIGKLMNYSPLQESVKRQMKYNQNVKLNSAVTIKNSFIDTIPVKVADLDSLHFEYTLTQDNGYFDGEVRKIPVIARGVKETKGYFAALNNDTTVTYTFDKNLGEVNVRAEASVFPVLLDEMQHLYRYEYLCNEQMASKLKSLLLEKRLRAYLGEPFKHEKDIKELIKKLNAARKNQGTWGWWPDSDEEIWISLHVTEAMLMAQKDGYAISFDKERLYDYLRRQLVAKQDYSQLKTIELMHVLNGKAEIKDWLAAIERNQSYKPNLYEKLKLMRLKQLAGIKPNLDSLLKTKKQTMFGNSYWGDNRDHFWDNNIQSTLLVYQMLNAGQAYENEKAKIVNYFLEQRKDGQWRNTYESSLILETVLPYLLKSGAQKDPAKMQINGKTVTQFPYNQKLAATAKLEVAKSGTLPIYLTAYQQFQNSTPNKVNKDFVINTTLLQNGKAVTALKAGEVTTLKVNVEVKADADYVMVEVPIPAGCSYDSKTRSYWGAETHREYFKEKTAIFCTKLKQGKYTFDISLMPRYNGNYVLNPAKAEMMYFPVFFGREAIKQVPIN